MGCGGSKVDDLPLVTLCRERKQLIKAASDHRYAFAAAHVAYFYSLKDVGDAFRKFVEEELVVAGADSSPDSPVLTLPSDGGKSSSRRRNRKSSSSSTSISHSVDESKFKAEEQFQEEPHPHSHSHSHSHLHLSSDSDLDTDSGSATDSGHMHIEDSENENDVKHKHREIEEEDEHDPSSSYNFDDPYNYSSNYAQQNWGYPPNESSYGQQNSGYPLNASSYVQQNWGYTPNESSYDQQNSGYPQNVSNYRMYYMRKSSTPAKSMVYEEPERQVADSGYGYEYPGYPNDGFFGLPMGSPPLGNYENNRRTSPPALKPRQPPPSPPRVSTWDYLNFFDTYDAGGNNDGMYPGRFKSGYGSNFSSPDSTVVREREGIPELEDETEPEVFERDKMKSKANEEMNMSETTNMKANNINYKTKNVKFGEGTSRSVPTQNISSVESPSTDKSDSQEIKSSSDRSIDTVVSKGSVEMKKGVSFEVESSISTVDGGESSKLSSLTTLSVHGTRDIQEVVKEIRDEFESASNFGKEVALLLEVGKLPYQQRTAPLLKVILSRILYLLAPSMSSSPPPHRSSIKVTSRTMKMAKLYCEEPGGDFDLPKENLSSTLEKLYVWEKKLYKEVKDEEKLRVVYEKQCQKLRMLDEKGAESSKIDATQASIRKLLTKINVCIRAVDAISSRIHKLRDEELQPQLTKLIQGLIRMWRSMLKCHQKQFQAIMEGRARSLKANTGLQGDAGLKATLNLELELLNWCKRFNNWVNTQKSYVESLNEWLLRCLLHEPEETPDGPAPFSPSRIGAPQIFVVCHDWYQAMVRISEKEVTGAMSGFALTLHQLWERQDEEQRQRIKSEYLSKDFERQLRTLRMESGKMKHDQDSFSDKTAVSKISDSGVSPLDDLKVDLDSMRKRLQEEKARHKEAIKLVHNAASSSLQAGLVPIFEALNKFTTEVVNAHEQVRLQNAGVPTGNA